jgi:hypothetical protein
VDLSWARRKRSGRGDARRLVGREDNDPPAPQHMLPKFWGDTLSRRELNLDEHRRIMTSGARGVHEEDAWDSDCEVHEQPNTFFWPPVDQYDFVAAFEHAPEGVWPAEADDLFERLADEYRGYAPNVFAWAVLDVIPNLVEIVREILETDSTGRYFMHYDAQKARSYWANPPRIPMWIPVLPTSSTVEARLAAHWSAGFVFTRMRRRIRWERFPLRNCTLCGTRMRHSKDQSFVRDYRYGLEAPPRWCQSCTGRTVGRVCAKEIEFALQAYVAATGVVPVNLEMIRYIPNNRPGQVRDVMAAVRTTVYHQGKLSEIGLWPWGKAVVAAGVVDEFVQTKRGLQSEAKDGHWCLSVFERQVDDFLTNHGIDHEHEPRWPVHPEFNPRGLMRADWRLPDGTMVEAAGMLGVPRYAAKIEQKRALANALNLKLVVITPEQTLKLDEVFKPWLTTPSVPEQHAGNNATVLSDDTRQVVPHRHQPGPRTEAEWDAYLRQRKRDSAADPPAPGTK